MELNGPKNTPSTATAAIPSRPAPEWSVGQQLSATIVSRTTNGIITINIGGMLYSTSSNVPLNVGQLLKLSVLSPALPTIAKALNMPKKSPTPPQGAPSNLNQFSQHTKSTAEISMELSESLRASLKKGDIIDARVGQPLSTNQTTLYMKNQRATAYTPTALERGSRLTLELIKIGEPAQLKIVTPITSHQGMKPYLRKNITIQQNYAPLMANLLFLSQSNHSLLANKIAALDINIAEQLKHIARQILGNLVTSQSITSAAGVKLGIWRSGVFLESLLKSIGHGQAPDTIHSDLKSNLLRLLRYITQQHPKRLAVKLAHLVEPPPPPMRHAQPTAQATVGSHLSQPATMPLLLEELLVQTKGVLARLLLSQLASGESNDDGKRIINAEVPVQHGQSVDIFHFRIAQEKSSPDNKSEQSVWSISLALNIEALGPVHVNISLQNKLIYTTFWSEQQETKNLICKKLNLLKNKLYNAGIQVAQLNSYHGKPPNLDDNDKPPSTLLDINV